MHCDVASENCTKATPTVKTAVIPTSNSLKSATQLSTLLASASPGPKSSTSVTAELLALVNQQDISSSASSIQSPQASLVVPLVIVFSLFCLALVVLALLSFLVLWCCVCRRRPHRSATGPTPVESDTLELKEAVVSAAPDNRSVVSSNAGNESSSSNPSDSSAGSEGGLSGRVDEEPQLLGDAATAPLLQRREVCLRPPTLSINLSDPRGRVDEAPQLGDAATTPLLQRREVCPRPRTLPINQSDPREHQINSPYTSVYDYGDENVQHQSSNDTRNTSVETATTVTVVAHDAHLTADSSHVSTNPTGSTVQSASDSARLLNGGSNLTYHDPTTSIEVRTFYKY